MLLNQQARSPRKYCYQSFVNLLLIEINVSQIRISDSKREKGCAVCPCLLFSFWSIMTTKSLFRILLHFADGYLKLSKLLMLIFCSVYGEKSWHPEHNCRGTCWGAPNVKKTWRKMNILQKKITFYCGMWFLSKDDCNGTGSAWAARQVTQVKSLWRRRSERRAGEWTVT